MADRPFGYSVLPHSVSNVVPHLHQREALIVCRLDLILPIFVLELTDLGKLKANASKHKAMSYQRM
jgi:hypothetical protein